MNIPLGLTPVRLPANQPDRFYRGGQAIAALRGTTPKEFGPEDWVASCTTLHGAERAGLSTLPDGTLLREAIAKNPTNWLGEAHEAKFGADPALLVKLLDAGQRLPVHCHPANDFAAEHYNSPYGKTESWIAVGTEPGATVHIGFTEDLGSDTVTDLVAQQDSTALLAALNEVTIAPGDAVFVPAGLPHAIGAGVFVVELQQPTDLSVMLEWQNFVPDEASAHLGIGFDTALRCVDRTGWADRLDQLVSHDDGTATKTELFHRPEFFRAERLRAGATLDPSFGVLVVLAGDGVLHTENAGDAPLTTGATYVLPHATGTATITGDVTAIRCLPPIPA